MSKEPDIAILGAGPSGLFSVFTAGMMGLRSFVFDSQEEIGGQCVLYPDKPLYDIAGFPKINANELISNLKKQAEPFRPEYHLGTKIFDIKSQKNGDWQIITHKDDAITVKSIIIAGGIGSFEPRKPPIKGLKQFENKTIFYHVPDKSIFADKTIVIAGGGDTAADWAIELSEIAKKVIVVHRRAKFRCHPSSEKCIQDLIKKGIINLLVPYQLADVKGDASFLQEVSIQNISDKSTKKISCDYLLPFFGMSADLGPIKTWGLKIENNLIHVDSSTMNTGIKGIYAVGDITHYPGKLKLILSGFSDAAIAAHAIRSYIHPDKAFHFEYSTTQGINPL